MVYRLKDQTDQSIKDMFYNNELQNVIEPGTYRIITLEKKR